MEKARRLLGRLVYARDGRCLGEVADCLLDDKCRRLAGLVIKAPLWHRPRYAAARDISSITSEAVHLRVSRLPYQPIKGRRLFGSGASLLGKIVVTTGGTGNGQIKDVLLDRRRLEVWGFEVSDGLVKDVLEGAKYLPRALVGRLAAEPGHMNAPLIGKHTWRGGERP